ncbi:relaxase/mobilization nuclease domain-containing protein [Polaromonas sp.]|uniref:relaxase/mobilization nuclease domain-containing protein n=1 Tax=Polaromonas sp. TaxID=1869339 RepID=UPI0013BD33AC|nr:relaxase/mobilization nuclease domain-containing protein [Polaromonas sp.]NDP64644.1 relaxase/mobilization nuclease domain-containing protein [Polaromonas sp.]
MIAKKIPNTKKSSGKSARVAGLCEYITEPELSNQVEKCIFSEAVNFLTDDLKSQTLEMIALSQEAVKSKDPIDHWVLSWQSNEKPTALQAQQAAAIFIKQCGLTGHQYITGLHDDTDNVHLHIAVNRVHPDTCKVIKINKGFDKEAAQQAIAIIEKRQGWSIEAGARYLTNDNAELVMDSATKRPQIFTAGKKPLQPTSAAQAMEVQTGEKSAQRIGIEQAAPLIAKATSWKDLHTQMAAAGLEYRREGSGAKVYVGGIAVKASDVDRKASFGNLQKRFGPYQPPQEINPNEYHHHPQEPHPAAPGKAPRHGMRKLSECHLAVLTNQGQTRRAGVLHLDARAGGRSADGLRWGAGRVAGDAAGRAGAGRADAFRAVETGRAHAGGVASALQPNGRIPSGHQLGASRRHAANPSRADGLATRRTNQPLRANQPGWDEYTALRDAQQTAKTHDTMALQKRHEGERAALARKLKAERSVLLAGNWKGEGQARNLLVSFTAMQQAAQKLELSAQHKAERQALQARYKPLPMYRQWKDQPQIVSLHVLPASEQSRVASTSPVATTLRWLTLTVDARQHTTYQLFDKDVFRDEGRTIVILDLNSEAGIAAALAIGQEKFGNVLTLTGPAAFQHDAVAVAVANNLSCRFADPALEVLRERLQAEKYQAERQASLRLEKAAEAVLTPSRQPAEQDTVPGRRAKPIKLVLVPTVVKEAVTSQAPENDQPAAEAAEVAEAHRLAQEEKAKQAEAEQLAEERRLAEGVKLADIHQQIDAAKAAAEPSSKLALSATTQADNDTPAGGVVIASNSEFVAVQVNDKVKLYKTAELTKNLKYDGIDTGHGRFAPGNEIERKNGEEGMRTLLREVRNAMQTEENKQRALAKGQGR